MQLSEAIGFYERTADGQGLGGTLFQAGLQDFWQDNSTEQSRCDVLHEGMKVVANVLKMHTDRCPFDMTVQLLPGGVYYGEHNVEDVEGGCVGVPIVQPQKVVIGSTEIVVQSKAKWQAEAPSDWRTAGDGDADELPERAVWLREGLLRLYKFPHATVRVLDAFIVGYCRPRRPVWANDEALSLFDFDLPECSHMPCVLIGAAWSAGLLATHEGSWQQVQHLLGEDDRLSRYLGAFKEVERIAMVNSRALTGDSHGDEWEDWI